MRKFIWLGCLSYFVIGMSHVVSGSVLESVIQWYNLDYQDGGKWIMNHFLGFLAGVLAAPTIIRRMGRRNTILLSMGSLAAVQAAFSLFLPWGWMLALAPIAGFGFGTTEAVIGAVIIENVHEKKAAAMIRLEIFYGLGALIMPVIASLLIVNNVWYYVFPIVAVLSGIVSLLWLTLSFAQADDLIAYPSRTHSHMAQKLRYSRASIPFLTFGVLFFLLYVGMEISFANYLPSIMIERTGMNEAMAASTISIFYGIMVLGRLFNGRIAEWSGHRRFLMVSAAGSALMFVFIVLSGNTTVNLLLIGLIGLLWSGIFPIGLVYTNQLIMGMTERTTSLLIAFGGLGGALLPGLTGWMMDRYNVLAVLWMMAGVAILMIILLTLQGILGKQLEVRELETELQLKKI